MRTNTGERVLWLLTGAGIGAGVALLFAPKTGKDMRRYLSKVAEDGRDRLVEGSQDALDKGKQAIERGKAVVDEALDYVERGRRLVMR
jgi:gas vesicle protein